LRNLLNAFLCFSLLIFSHAAFSNSPVSGTTILEVGSYSSGRIFVHTATNGSVVNPAGCSKTTFVLSKDDANFAEMYSALLLALANSGTVDLIISSASCVDQYPKIIYVGAKPS